MAARCRRRRGGETRAKPDPAPRALESRAAALPSGPAFGRPSCTVARAPSGSVGKTRTDAVPPRRDPRARPSRPAGLRPELCPPLCLPTQTAVFQSEAGVPLPGPGRGAPHVQAHVTDLEILLQPDQPQVRGQARGVRASRGARHLAGRALQPRAPPAARWSLTSVFTGTLKRLMNPPSYGFLMLLPPRWPARLNSDRSPSDFAQPAIYISPLKSLTILLAICR